MNYAIFLKHRTGDTAVIHVVGDTPDDARARIEPALGEGWQTVGALVRFPSRKIPSRGRR